MEAFEVVSKKVKEALKKRGMTQGDLAKKLGVERETVTQALGRNIQIDTLFKWAKELGVSPSELVDTGEPSVEELRLACITAILNAKPADLRLFREAFPRLFETATDEFKGRSSG